MAKRTRPVDADSSASPVRPRSRRNTTETEPQAAAPDSRARELSDEEIRERAYHRYLERGSRDGMEFEDWLEAERELKQKR